jgi:hypothetical protein
VQEEGVLADPICGNIHGGVFPLPFTPPACARGTNPFEEDTEAVVVTPSPVLGLVTGRDERPTAEAVVPSLVLSGMRSAEVVADFLRAEIAGTLMGVRLLVAAVGLVFGRVPETGCGGRREVCGRAAISVADGLVTPVAEGATVGMPTSSPSERKDCSSAGEWCVSECGWLCEGME